MKGHDVVINGCYMKVWQLHGERLKEHGAEVEKFMETIGVTNKFKVADSVGDCIESASGWMLAAQGWRAYIELLELCFWEDRVYDTNERTADQNLHDARLYVPEAIKKAADRGERLSAAPVIKLAAKGDSDPNE